MLEILDGALVGQYLFRGACFAHAQVMPTYPEALTWLSYSPVKPKKLLWSLQTVFIWAFCRWGFIDIHLIIFHLLKTFIQIMTQQSTIVQKYQKIMYILWSEFIP